MKRERNTDRALEDLEAIFHQIRREYGKAQFGYTRIIEIIREINELREEFKRLEIAVPQLPRSIYIVEGHEKKMLSFMADADLVLLMEESGYKDERSYGEEALVTDAHVIKNRWGTEEDVITIYESWPS